MTPPRCLFLGFSFFALLHGCGDDSSSSMPTARVKRGVFQVRLPIQGEMEAVESKTISAPDLGGNTKVTFIVEEGEIVSEGDLLVEFEKTDLENSLVKLRNDLEIAHTKIKQKQAQLQLQLNTLSDAVTKAQLSLARSKLRITESEAVPRVDRESARLDVQQSELDLEKSRKDLESADMQGKAELELLRLEARQAENQVAVAERRMTQAKVFAPAGGLVIKPEIWKGGSHGPVKAGDTVWRGSTLIQLPDMSDMQVIAWVHETDAEQVKVDQPVSIVLDAHPEPPFPARVGKLADLAVQRNENDKSKYLKVTVALDRVDPVMKPGMTARAEVLVDQVPDAVFVPLEGVFYVEGEPGVFKRDGGSWDRIPVRLGRTSDTHVVVTEGLSEDDEVALVDPERWARGESTSAARESSSESSASKASSP